MLIATEWWKIICDYGAFMWPWQFAIMGVGVILTGLFIIGPSKIKSVLIKGYFFLTNGWIAFGFFLNPQRGFPSPLKESQAALFILIALLWLYDLLGKRTQFSLPKKKKGLFLFALASLIVYLYPLWGLLLGHKPVGLIVPGAYPCPTTALSLIFIISAREKRNPLLYLFLLIWAIPFPPTVQIPQYGVWEDVIMFVLGVAALFKLGNYYLYKGISLKTNKDKIASPNAVIMALAVLKGYISFPGPFLFSTVIGLPKLIVKNKKDYPVDFLKSSGLTTLLYKGLIPSLGKEKAFEVVRAVIIPIGLATQQANFRNVEEPRTFENLVKYQQRTNREGPTRLNTIEIEEQSEREYRFKVSRCLFLEFFNSQGVPELTKLMCTVDNAIFNIYRPEEIFFHRDGVGNRMADGCAACQFVVEKLDV
ncbi:MAG: DUF6064 family protein [Spirochaetales bacterium]|nr:DUF6064 family protein [Spirochaetales bacterium]